MKYCPYCGAGLDAEMSFCPKCGQRFVDANSGAVQKRTAHSDDIYKVEINSDKVKVQSAGSKAVNGERTIRRSKSWFGWIFGVGAVLLAVFLFFWLGGIGIPRPILNSRGAVVRIVVEFVNGEYALGSGFIISSDQNNSYIVTNAHVVDGNRKTIYVEQGDKETKAAVKRSFENRDLCILVTNRLSGRPLSLSNSDVKQGTEIFAAGFPAAADLFSDQFDSSIESITITNGIVSALRSATLSEYGDPVKLIQINAAINPGNSGGPLLDRFGRVVGVNTFGVDEAQGINAAIAVSELKSVLQKENIVTTNQSLLSSMVPENIPVWVYAVLAAVIVVIILIFILIINGVSKRKYISSLSETELKEYKKERARRRKKNRKVALIIIGVTIILLALAFGIYYSPYYLISKGKFSKAERCVIVPELRVEYDPYLSRYIEAGITFEKGDYEKASSEFLKLPFSYQKTEEYYKESRYRRAKQLAAANDWFNAISWMKSLAWENYKDSAYLTNEYTMQSAKNLEQNGNDVLAYRMVLELFNQGYKPAANYLQQISEKLYNKMVAAFDSGSYREAKEICDLLEDYKDSAEYLAKCKEKIEEYRVNVNLDEPISVSYVIQHYEGLKDKHFILDALVSSNSALNFGAMVQAQDTFTGLIYCADTTVSIDSLSGSTENDMQKVLDGQLVRVSFYASNNSILGDLKRGDHVHISCKGITYSDTDYYALQFESIEVVN